jgi:acetylornithine aminotransferase
MNAQQVVDTFKWYWFGGSRIKKGDVACVIIEPIQGVGGLNQGTTEFFKH